APPPAQVCDDHGEHARIETAAHEDARAFVAEAARDGLLQQGLESLLGLVVGDPCDRAVAGHGIPVAVSAPVVVTAESDDATRRHASHAIEVRLMACGPASGQAIDEAGAVELGRHARMSEERFDGRRQQERPASLRVEQRANAEWITGTEEQVPRAIEDQYG